MAKLTQEESLRRREAIIDVAAELYNIMPFKDITINEIGKKIPFTRTAIYTYFENREEIFLALLEREYLAWESELEQLLGVKFADKESFAKGLAETLSQRQIMLKILSVDMAALDHESRLERVIAFKKVYGRTLSLVGQVLKYACPEKFEKEVQGFVFAFFPFMYGIHPYTDVTQKQRQAMAEAEVPYVYMTAKDLTINTILNLLK